MDPGGWDAEYLRQEFLDNLHMPKYLGPMNVIHLVWQE